ncbi:MAG: cytochrome C oxidase subunit IV family protein [Myxococcota bacterium]
MVSESHQSADGKVHAHITPVKAYWAIFGALIFFTLLTVGVSYIHLGSLNLVVAIAIATVKAALVVLYFMHMKYETKFNVLVFLSALLFMGIFLAYTMNDTEYRADLDTVNGGRVDPRTGQLAYGTPQELVAQLEAQQERDAKKARQADQPAVGYEDEPPEALGEGVAETADAGAAEPLAEGGEEEEAAEEAADEDTADEDDDDDAPPAAAE